MYRKLFKSKRQGIGDPNVAKSNIFSCSNEPSHRHSPISESVCQKPCSPKTELSSSTNSQFSTDDMQIIRQSLSKYRISPEIANFIMLSWRESTKKQYNVYINQHASKFLPKSLISANNNTVLNSPRRRSAAANPHHASLNA